MGAERDGIDKGRVTEVKGRHRGVLGRRQRKKKIPGPGSSLWLQRGQ